MRFPSMWSQAVLALVLMAALPAQSGADTRHPASSELTADSFARWRKAIEPSAEEMAWRRIPWRAELGEALAAGRQAKKPVMLWAMNGHPLGCV